MNLRSTDCESLEELAQGFREKASLLKSSLGLRNLDQESCSALNPIKNQVAELKLLFENIRYAIQTLEKEINVVKDLSLRVEIVDSKVSSVNKNFPETLRNLNKASEKLNNQPQDHKVQKVSDKANNVSKKHRSVAQIKPITVDEFNTIPKYMKGRTSYFQINEFVNCFNKTLTAKYKLLSTPRSELKNTAYKMVQKMKAEENKETAGLYFCVNDDLKDLGNIKMDNPTRNMLTMLRHCCRVREIRGPGPILRHCVQE